MSNNLRPLRPAMTPPPTPAAASSSAPLLPVTAEPLPTAEQTVVVRQPSFPFPVYHWQPRRHFSGGPGVGYFSDPSRGRALTVSIFETSARLYPAVRHHHIRMTTITAAGNRNLYRAALFLVDQPDHLTYDMRGVPGASDSGSYSGGSFGQTNDIVLIGIGRGHGNGNGSSIGSSRVIRAQNGRGHGNGGVAVENGSSGLGNGGGGGGSDNNDAGNGTISGNSSRSGYDGDDEDDGEDIDVYIGPYSSGIPEYRQRMVLIGPIGETVDEALEGLEGVVVREWERQIA